MSILVDESKILVTKEKLANIRDYKLSQLCYDAGGGRIFQVRPLDEQNLRGAIDLGVTPREWVMADNTVALVTIEEIELALHSGLEQAAAVFQEYINGLKLL